MSKSTRAKHAKSSGKPILHSYGSAFEKTAEARAKLGDKELLTINLDVRVALTTVIGAVPAVSVYRDAIKASLPAIDIAQIDQLLTYAQALAVAHGDYLAAAAPAEALPGLQARAMKVRDQLVIDATALAGRGLLDGKRLADLKRGPGYLNMTSDLAVLVRLLREKWSDIASKSAIQLADLDEADALFEKITSAYGARQQKSVAVAAATLERQRAYTLLLKAYDEVRRALSFLRWREDDVEKIAPSLWAGRGQRSGNAGTANAGAPASGAATAPGATAVVAADSAYAGASAAAAHGVTPPPAPVAVGMPGGNPFIN